MRTKPQYYTTLAQYSREHNCKLMLTNEHHLLVKLADGRGAIYHYNKDKGSYEIDSEVIYDTYEIAAEHFTSMCFRLKEE